MIRAVIDSAVAAVPRLFTGVRTTGLDRVAASGPCIYFANHTSHGDFVLIWSVLPPQLRRRARPVAGAEYWCRSPMRRAICGRLFQAVMVDRGRQSR